MDEMRRLRYPLRLPLTAIYRTIHMYTLEPLWRHSAQCLVWCLVSGPHAYRRRKRKAYAPGAGFPMCECGSVEVNPATS